jgi:hypothetical protein
MPTLGSDVKAFNRPASLNEKADDHDAKVISHIDEKSSSVDRIVDLHNVEEVFAEGPRLIDLGADGKERPIRAFL